MKIGVLSIQGAVSEHLQRLKDCSVEAVTVKDPASLSSVSGLIIPGGESTTIGKLIELAGLKGPITELSKSGNLAIFGTCAGMVLMARQVIDGVEKQPKLELMDIQVKRNAFGRQKESFETELNFKPFEQTLTGVFIRSPLVREAGEGVEIMAAIPEGIVAARQGNLLATSFHPELTNDTRIHQYFVDMCRNIKEVKKIKV